MNISIQGNYAENRVNWKRSRAAKLLSVETFAGPFIYTPLIY